MYENYKDEWRKDRFKSKSKTKEPREGRKVKVKNIKVCNTKVQIHIYYDKTKDINTKRTK
jgi:hypothetical protein